jgi:hypothetical protein
MRAVSVLDVRGRPVPEEGEEVAVLLARAKTIAWVLVVAFLIYAIFKSPDQAAAIVRTAWGGVVDGLHAIGRFFDALLGNGSSSS